MTQIITILLAAVVAIWPRPALTQPQSSTARTYDVLDLTAAEALRRIELDPRYRTFVVRNLIVGSPLRMTSTQLNITLPAGVTRSPTPVDVHLSGIESHTGATSRLIIYIAEGVRLGRLEIVGSARAAVDPLIEIAMARNSSVGKVTLTGGRYRSVLLRPDSANIGIQSAPVEISISDIKLGDLTVVGSDIGSPQPVELKVKAQILRPLYDVKVANFRLDNLQLRGKSTVDLQASFEGPNDRGAVGRTCETPGRLVTFNVARVSVGDQRGRMDEFGTSSLFELRLDENTCLTLGLQDMSLYGDVSIAGGTLTSLAIDNVNDPLGGRVAFQFSSVQALRFGTASLNQLQLDAKHQRDFGPPTIDQWGYVRVNERITLPDSVYDALSTSLIKKSSQRISGLRNFLVDVRWKSFSSDPPAKRAAPEVLMAVLASDAREIFGPLLSGVLWFATGFGKELWLPALCLTMLIFLPLTIAAFHSGIRRLRRGTMVFTNPMPYYSALIAGDNTALLATSPQLKYVVAIHRVVIAVEVGLVTLFIQNAVLTGT